MIFVEKLPGWIANPCNILPLFFSPNMLYWWQLCVWNAAVQQPASQSVITAMDEDAPTLKPRRIQNQNVVHRLERRRVCSGRPGAHWYRVRCFHQNLFPNFTVVNVEKPPCFLRKFSPDGRCFIAFSSDQTSLEVRQRKSVLCLWIYTLNGLHQGLANLLTGGLQWVLKCYREQEQMAFC